MGSLARGCIHRTFVRARNIRVALQVFERQLKLLSSLEQDFYDVQVHIVFKYLYCTTHSHKVVVELFVGKQKPTLC